MDGKPLSYGLWDDFIAPVDTSDPMYRANGSEYFTLDQEIIVCGSILSGTSALGSDPEVFRPFTNSFITDKALIWDNMVEKIQGKDAWTYMNPDKKHHDVNMGYKLI